MYTSEINKNFSFYSFFRILCFSVIVFWVLQHSWINFLLVLIPRMPKLCYNLQTPNAKQLSGISFLRVPKFHRDAHIEDADTLINSESNILAISSNYFLFLDTYARLESKTPHNPLPFFIISEPGLTDCLPVLCRVMLCILDYIHN